MKSLELKLEQQVVSYALYQDFTPEKIELIDGLLLGEESAAEKMLLILIFNLGVERTLQLIPNKLIQEFLIKDKKN